MANEEHLKILNQRVEVWNQWRAENPLTEPDLSKAFLLEAKLSEANLSMADLREAELSRADLRGANLSFADCRNAKLQKAHLTGALLSGIASFGWDISDVQCDYIYLDYQKTRKPSNRSFVLGEFERIYRSLPVVIEFVFEHGMQLVDTLLMDWIAARLQQERPKLQLELVLIDRKGIYPTAIFAISSPEHKEETYNEIKKRYEETIQILKRQNKQSQRMIQQLFDHNRLLLEKFDHSRLIDTGGGSYIEARDTEIYIKTKVKNTVRIRDEFANFAKKENLKQKTKHKFWEHVDNLEKKLPRKELR